MVLDEIATVLRALLERHTTMSVTLQSVLDKLTQQGQDLATQGREITALLAERDARKEADLQKISDVLDANAVTAKANADMLVSALTSEAEVVQSGAASTEQGTSADLDPATGLPRT